MDYKKQGKREKEKQADESNDEKVALPEGIVRKQWNEAQQKQRNKKILHHQTNTISNYRHKNNSATISGDAEQKSITQRRNNTSCSCHKPSIQ